MIHYIKGDLLESHAQALVNTVNTVGVMGKGIALQFKETFPENFKRYRKACKEGDVRVGEMFITEETSVFNDKKIIINFPTKTHWRRPSEYIYIAEGLKALKKEIEEKNIKSIAIPPLGSHNGGLDWSKVKAMIEESLGGLESDIYLYEPSDNIKEKMKSERVKMTTAKAMLLILLADLSRYGEFASVFSAEKVIYFLQRFGAKKYFNIDFSPYYYGPYSEGKVAHLLYDMNGSYVRGMGAMQSSPFDFIWLADDAEKEALNFLNRNGDSQAIEICSRTMNFLQFFYSTLSLELLSTTDYILNHTKSLNNWKEETEGIVKEKVLEEIKRYSSRKKNILKPEFVSIALNHLKAI